MSNQLPTDEEHLDFLRQVLGVSRQDGEPVVCGSMFGKGKTQAELHAEEMEQLHRAGPGHDEEFRRWLRQASGGARG